MKINLKHIFFPFLIIFLSAGSLIAQKGFNAGINVGYNASAVFDRVKFGDVAYNIKPKTGPAFGIGMGYNFTDMLGIEVEANYLYMGGKYSIPVDNIHYNKSFDLTYFQVPVMFKFTGGDYLSRFSSMVGPAWGWLNSAKMTSDSGYTGDAKSMFKVPDMGLLVCAGGDVTLSGSIYMNIALRFYYGFNSINNDPHAISYDKDETEKLGNAYIGLNLGFHNMFVKEKPPVAPNW